MVMRIDLAAITALHHSLLGPPATRAMYDCGFMRRSKS
jgi:hypothetical protein